MAIKRKTLKIPKNPRKYKIWESSQLSSTMEQAAQIMKNIEDIAEKENIPIHLLPPASIPVHLMYDICDSYVNMYTKLLNEQLLITGNPKTNPLIH